LADFSSLNTMDGLASLIGPLLSSVSASDVDQPNTSEISLNAAPHHLGGAVKGFNRAEIFESARSE
jgi:hypothetical protein